MLSPCDAMATVGLVPGTSPVGAVDLMRYSRDIRHRNRNPIGLFLSNLGGHGRMRNGDFNNSQPDNRVLRFCLSSGDFQLSAPITARWSLVMRLMPPHCQSSRGPEFEGDARSRDLARHIYDDAMTLQRQKARFAQHAISQGNHAYLAVA